MIKKEEQHLIEILEQTKKAFTEQDVLKLKELSNQTVHSASVNQDAGSIAIAVIIYSLGKVIQKRSSENFNKCDEFCMKTLRLIEKLISTLQKEDTNNFNKNLEEMNLLISKLSPDLRIYIQDVFSKAKINKASKIYEHGISMGQTAKLLGISQYELASYAGQSQVSEMNLNLTQSVKARIKLAMEMFR